MRRTTFFLYLFCLCALSWNSYAQNISLEKLVTNPKLALKPGEMQQGQQPSPNLPQQPTISSDTKVEFTKKKELSLKKGNWILNTEQSFVKQQNNKKNVIKKAVADMSGVYIQKDYSHYTPDEVSYTCIAISKVDDTTLKILNFWGMNSEITATINADANTISIAPQMITNHQTYGPVFIYSVDLNTMKYSTTDPITGTIDANGVVTLASWGVFVAEGKYAGSCFDAMDKTELVLTNAVISNVLPKETEKYGALIEQKYDNELSIINFANNGRAVNVTLNADKSLSISPQYIFTNSTYGDFYCSAADWSTSGLIEGSIQGTGTANSLTLGSWGVFNRIQSSLCAMQVLSTSITTSITIRYPKELNVDFEGSGTASAPYQIKTVENLQMLSQQVNKGTNYKGKYFKLMTDLDISTMTSRFRVIGDSESHAFAGTFDGNGKTIFNLELETGGDNFVGLFGVLDAAGTIKNLNMKGINYVASGSYIGGIVGKCIGNLENCTVEGKIAVKNVIAGGVAGYVYGVLKNSSFSGSISGFGDTGGVAGANYGQVLKCWANASVTMDGYISSMNRATGGVVGSQVAGNRTDCQTADCYFVGSVSDTYGYGYIGGVVGEALKGKVTRCFNVGSVSTMTSEEVHGSAGGVIGFTLELTVTDCYNAGTVVNSNNGLWVGGVIGYIMKGVDMGGGEPDPTVIKNIYNSGMVNSASMNGQKALYGEIYSEDILQNAYFDKQVTGLSAKIGEMSTVDMTSENGLSGFDSSIWTFTKGLYPRLKGIDNVDAAYLSAAAMTLNGNETIKKVKKNFKVSTANNIIWKVFFNKNFVDSDDGLSISGSDVTLKNIYSTELLCAFTPDQKSFKFYSLALVAKMFDGEGTEESPYLIKSKEDFINLNKATTVHGQPHEGDYFKMTNDIDFGYGEDFSGVAANGNSSYAFAGIFDGDGYAIHKLKIVATGFDDKGTAITTGAYLYPGLFGLCTQTSVIKNIVVADDCDFTFWAYGGPIAGYTEGRIENCFNYSDVNAVSGYIAGIAGMTGETAVISNCYNAGKILAGETGAGGIVGYNIGTIEFSQNDGEVLADFFNAYKKKGTQSTAGGIAGLNYGTINSSSNNGYVASYKNVGGIVGGNSNAKEAGNVTSCVNTALVDCLSDEITKGGIIGNLAGKNVIADNYYDAQINTSGGANNAKVSGINGLTTKELTKGTVLTNLSDDVWSFVANGYPVLKLFANEEAAIAARNIYVAFADEESRSAVKTEATLSNRSSLTWTLKQNKNFQISGRKLMVTIPTDETVAYDTLVAVYDNYQKAYPIMAIPEILKGTGTEKSPFLIETTEDMTKLANFIEKFKMEYSGSHFLLVNDLDYTDKEYVPVSATGSIKFQGYFNGNGKKISNVNYEKTTSSSKYIGLFGTVGESGTISNLTFESGFIKVYTYAAGLVGRLYGTIDNCINKANVETSNSTYAAGIASIAYEGATIKNSSNYGKIVTKSDYAAGIVGSLSAGAVVDGCFNSGEIAPTKNYGAGIAALSKGTVQNSYNTGKVSGVTYMAGIVASHADGCTIMNCYNTAEISGTSGTVGGIIATTANKVNTLIDNCYNTGDISGGGTIGGIAGKVQGGNDIQNCYNTGNITSTKANAGGIAASLGGATDYETNLINCYNKGNVTCSSGNYVAGVVGTISSGANLENCYNLGTVSATGNFVGGFSGGCSSPANNCWNAGDVTSDGYGVGGFSGIGSGTVTNSFNVGNVTSNGGSDGSRFPNVGGFWGYGNPELANCYNMGTLTAPDFVGGFIGVALLDGLKMTNCYNGGKIVTTATTKIGNIIMPYSEGIVIESKNVYFDKSVNPVYPVDSIGTGLTTAEMTKAGMGDDYVYATATYPVLKNFTDNKIANFYAATVVFDGQDTFDNVTADFQIGTPSGITWTASEHFVIEGNDVIPVKVGKGTLTVTADDLTKTYSVNVTKANSIDETMGMKECISRTYYTVSGMLISKPSKGIYIVKSLYDDGTEEISKVIIE